MLGLSLRPLTLAGVRGRFFIFPAECCRVLLTIKGRPASSKAVPLLYSLIISYKTYAFLRCRFSLKYQGVSVSALDKMSVVLDKKSVVWDKMSVV